MTECGPHLLYPSVCQWTVRFLHGLVIVNSAAMNIEVHISIEL